MDGDFTVLMMLLTGPGIIETSNVQSQCQSVALTETCVRAIDDAVIVELYLGCRRNSIVDLFIGDLVLSFSFATIFRS